MDQLNGKPNWIRLTVFCVYVDSFNHRYQTPVEFVPSLDGLSHVK